MDKKRILKMIGTIGLAGILAGGAVFMTSCKDKPQDDPTKDPNKPNPVEKTDLEIAQFEYDKVVLSIKNAESLTATSQDETIEIQGKNLKKTADNTSKFVETTAEGTSFEYSLQEDGYHKNNYQGTLTAAAAKSTIVALVSDVKWTALENGRLSQKDENLSATYTYDENDSTKNTLTLTTAEGETVTINHLGSTLVTLPEAIDDTQEKPPVEEFKLTAENIEAIKDAIRVHIDIMNKNLAKTTLEVKSVYLTKSEGSEIVDTIGAIYTARSQQGGTYFYWNEMTIPTQEELSYEKFYKNQVAEYDRFDARIKTLYSFVNGDEQNNAEMVEIIKSQMFKEDYASGLWSGWKITPGMSSDIHTITNFNGTEIKQYVIEVYKDYSNTPSKDAVNKNFKDQLPSASTYTIMDTKTYNIEDENRIFLVVENQEPEQE